MLNLIPFEDLASISVVSAKGLEAHIETSESGKEKCAGEVEIGTSSLMFSEKEPYWMPKLYRALDSCTFYRMDMAPKLSKMRNLKAVVILQPSTEAEQQELWVNLPPFTIVEPSKQIAFASDELFSMIEFVHNHLSENQTIHSDVFLDRFHEQITRGKLPEDYLSDPYERVLTPDSKSGGYVSRISELSECLGQGETALEAFEDIEKQMVDWVGIINQMGNAVAFSKQEIKDIQNKMKK